MNCNYLIHMLSLKNFSHLAEMDIIYQQSGTFINAKQTTSIPQILQIAQHYTLIAPSIFLEHTIVALFFSSAAILLPVPLKITKAFSLSISSTKSVGWTVDCRLSCSVPVVLHQWTFSPEVHYAAVFSVEAEFRVLFVPY